MAVEPLFNADIETLKKRVRVNLSDDDQTNETILWSIQEVRVGFFNRLGAARVSDISGYALVDNPSTESELLRMNGANAEALWVQILLMQSLPYLFMDNSASVNDTFNDVPLSRDTQKDKDIQALQGRLDSLLGDLETPINTESGPVKAASITADTTNLIYDNFLGLYPNGRNSGSSI